MAARFSSRNPDKKIDSTQKGTVYFWGPLWIEIRTYFKDNFYSEPAQKLDDVEIAPPKETSDGNPDD